MLKVLASSFSVSSNEIVLLGPEEGLMTHSPSVSSAPGSWRKSPEPDTEIASPESLRRDLHSQDVAELESESSFLSLAWYDSESKTGGGGHEEHRKWAFSLYLLPRTLP